MQVRPSAKEATCMCGMGKRPSVIGIPLLGRASGLGFCGCAPGSEGNSVALGYRFSCWRRRASAAVTTMLKVVLLHLRCTQDHLAACLITSQAHVENYLNTESQTSIGLGCLGVRLAAKGLQSWGTPEIAESPKADVRASARTESFKLKQCHSWGEVKVLEVDFEIFFPFGSSTNADASS